jgi:UDP-N-acetylglucosamine 2-epimerase (non-hydrolysing)
MSEALKLLLVAGARPNFMKVAPLIHAIERRNASRTESTVPIDCCLVHTGQHYDAAMSEIFFRELGIPEPQVNLGVGSGSHAVQTANVMIGFEKVCAERKPDWVVVFGDVNSTVACSLVAAKLGIRVAHVEAGLRSFDRTMPEEINRVVTDALADLLFAPSEDAMKNLSREGVPGARMRLVGNIMIDSLVANLPKAKQSTALERFSVEPHSFIYVTLHRPANVDSRSNLTAIAAELKKLSHKLPVVFPVHPRTRKMFSEFGLDLAGHNGFRLAEPIGYHDSIWLTQNARIVLTDSGGLQEEATYFQTPCLTLRPNTERPVTIDVGSNRLTKVDTLSADLGNVLSQARRLGSIPPLWDGKTSERIVDALCHV